MLRDEEFSPLKNNLEAKSDNARTCKQDISNLHRRWLKKAGASLEENSSDDSAKSECEISPLVSFSGEVSQFDDLRWSNWCIKMISQYFKGLECLVKGKTLTLPLHLELDVKTNKILVNGNEQS